MAAKQKKNTFYRRLFWKFFVVFWLSSFISLLITVFIMREVNSEQRQQGIQYRAQFQALRIIHRYERGLPLAARVHPDHAYKKHPRHLPLKIFDSQQRLIFDSTRKAPPGAPQGRLMRLTSDSGQTYQIRIPPNPELSRFNRLVNEMLSLQTLIILLASALASIVLSALVIRPIKQLRHYVASLHEGETWESEPDAMNPRLLSRQDEIGDLAREFNQMAIYVADSLNDQQRLLADVSHQLRAPLARLQVAAGLAEQQLGENNSLSERIHLETERLDHLLQEVLEFARTAQSQTTTQRFDVTAVTAAAIADLQFSQPQRQVEFSLPLAADGSPKPIFCQGNKALFERAISNICNNIIQHTQAEVAVEVNLSTTATEIHLRIQDYGSGVSEQGLAQLFKPFFREAEDNQGYGLGLSIAQQAIQRLGGHIKASNQAEGGLEIEISLPVAVAPH